MDLLSSFENVLTSRIEIESGMEKYINSQIRLKTCTIIANARPKLPTLPPASSVADLPSVDALTQNAHSSSNPGNLK